MRDLGLAGLRRGRRFGLGGLSLVVSMSGGESDDQERQELQGCRMCEGAVMSGNEPSRVGSSQKESNHVPLESEEGSHARRSGGE